MTTLEALEDRLDYVELVYKQFKKKSSNSKRTKAWKKMKNIKLQVDWRSERVNDNDNNNGFYYGIYTFDCLEKDFDSEAGFGSYSILDAQWYKTEQERDLEFNKQ